MIIDLSVTINDQTPIYPGDPPLKIEPAGVLERDGYCDHYVSIGTHVGTHIDAPMHMIKDGKALSDLDASNFIGNGVYVDVTSGDLTAVKNIDIKAGDIVVLHTGMGDKYHEESYFQSYPVMSEDIANFLVSRKVKMVGVDTCSVDNQDGFPIHKILLKGGVLIIENLSSLEKLKGLTFMVYALPIKMELDGAPARVVAISNA